MNAVLPAKRIAEKKDVYWLLLIIIAVLVIYYPVLYTQYIYTDEGPQFWLAQKGANDVYIQDGRWITFLLNDTFFNHTDTAKEVIHARWFSLAGWLICLPLWYIIIKQVSANNGLPPLLYRLATLYIVCMPPFTVYIGWAVCQEMFIASTLGLLSGYALYQGIRYDNNKLKISIPLVLLGAVLSICSLFTYQTGFGSFYIPFFIQLVAGKKITGKIIYGIAFAMLMYIAYFLLFKWSLKITHIGEGTRSAMASNPFDKLFFLFTRPLVSSFHFTMIFNEKSIAGGIIYTIAFATWFILNLTRLKAMPLLQKLMYFGGLVAFFILAYLPPILVAENYASNRTLFALNLIVFILVAETIFYFIQNNQQRTISACILGVFLVANAWYNFRWQFLYPIVAEYRTTRDFVFKNFSGQVNTVYVIRPAEDAFVKKYGIAASWDEFGVPSAAKIWTPESLLQQMVFEKTGNRAMADKLIVKSWENRTAFESSNEKISANTLLIDLPLLLETQ